MVVAATGGSGLVVTGQIFSFALKSGATCAVINGVTYRVVKGGNFKDFKREVCSGFAFGYEAGAVIGTVKFIKASSTVKKSGSSSKYLEQLDNLSENKINHMINGSKNSNHGWEKLVQDKNWSDIKNIIANVMDTGVEGTYKSVFSKKATINGFEVEVTYTKLSNGTIKISDAWIN